MKPLYAVVIVVLVLSLLFAGTAFAGQGSPSIQRQGQQRGQAVQAGPSGPHYATPTVGALVTPTVESPVTVTVTPTPTPTAAKKVVYPVHGAMDTHAEGGW